MGEVYRAHDAKLRRHVAVKVLPVSVAADSDSRSRLRREAQILASMNHPAISSIYDFIEADVFALVLELVEGPTLAERIAQGPIDVRTAIDIAAQLVDALDAAHEKGIVHRDLKPANIKLTPDDRVKVLDFGLAKAFARDTEADIAASPTVTGIRSLSGMISGTAPYMSPEQARGIALDKRVDVWAFGCVLYEMLTGRRAFEGGDFAEIAVSIMTKEPDWTCLPRHTPPRFVELLQRCLKRSIRERLRDIGDARADIVAAGSGDATTPRPLPRNQPVQFRRLTDFVGVNSAPAISPDGKLVAFVAVVGGHKQVWVRFLAGGTSLQLTRGAADHDEPRWAPDSSSLIYFSASDAPGQPGTIYEVSAFGGPSRPIAQALGGGDISHDGRRIAVFQSVNDRTELSLISRDGSTVDFVRPMPATMINVCPRWSPDDRSIAFHGHVAPYFDQRIFVTSIHGGAARDVVRGAILRGLSWVPDGSGIVYSSSADSALPYPPVFGLRELDLTSGVDWQLTFGDA
jgi:serine/threonine protein kinase